MRSTTISIGLLLTTLLLVGCEGDNLGNDTVQSLLGDSSDDTSDTPVEDDPGTLAFAEDTFDVLENAGLATVTVVRTVGTTGEVTVDLATQDGTALAGVDYQAASAQLTFADGVSSLNQSIAIIDDADTNDERSFTVTLSNPTGGADLGDPSTATVLIRDDETVGVYDFESLTLGPINGQDNWRELVTIAEVVIGTTLVNLSQVVQPTTTVLGDAGQTELTRRNDANFSFSGFTGATAEIQFDATADDNILFALGQDLDGDGLLTTAANEIGVPFGFWERQFTIFFANSLTSRTGVTALGDDNAATDWYQLRLLIDLDANGGEGAGRLSYRNLTRGDTAFQPVDGLQDVTLNLDTNLAPDEANWNAMFLLLRIDASNVPKADNLVPNLLE